MYKAIECFSDEGVIYRVGEEYPHEGKADKNKVKSFLSNNNGFNRPIIEEIKEDIKEETEDYGGYDYSSH